MWWAFRNTRSSTKHPYLSHWSLGPSFGPNPIARLETAQKKTHAQTLIQIKFKKRERERDKKRKKERKKSNSHFTK